MVRVVSKSFSRPENDTQALYDVDLELSPMSPGPCFPDDTPTGYYPELNNRVDNISTSDATGNVMYVVPTYAYSMVPVPFFAGTHHFGVVNIADAGARGGKFDAMPANVLNSIRCAVVGPGRITVHTRVWADKNPLSTYRAALEYDDVPTSLRLEHSFISGIPVGDDAVFEVPADGHCNHVVAITTEGGAENGVGFDGFDWVSYA